MTASLARPSRGAKRLSLALAALVLLALSACASPPPVTTPPQILRAPSDVTAVAGDGEATVSWTAPTHAENVQVDGYTVTSSDGQVMTTTREHKVTFTGLTNGTTYTFTVTAHNGNGESPDSEPSNEVIPGPQ